MSNALTAKALENEMRTSTEEEEDDAPDTDHHSGDEDDAYIVGECVLAIETAGIKVKIIAPDVEAINEVSNIAIAMIEKLRVGVQ